MKYYKLSAFNSDDWESLNQDIQKQVTRESRRSYATLTKCSLCSLRNVRQSFAEHVADIHFNQPHFISFL